MAGNGTVAERNGRLSLADFKASVSEWAQRIEVQPKEIHIRQMRNKWASVSTNGRLSFNAELLEMEKRYRDYVIVHELVHMKVPNHGKLFKSLMFAFLPKWESLAGQLGVRESAASSA
ncbi:MAG: M48 family metallopeptidase [Candidatus Omnitrophica bacterium]|nr:M48 family metallopeptidase [Candidatus Omnitrophota bacterium]